MQAWLKLANFPAKFHFRKQLGGMNRNAEGQFVTFSRSGLIAAVSSEIVTSVRKFRIYARVSVNGIPPP